MRSGVVLFISLVLVVSAGCRKKNSDVLIPDTPRSEVPGELVGKWLNGTFAMSDWWSYDGEYQGNPYTSSRAFSFSKNGDAEFFQVIKTYNGSCATEAFTYFKGTVKFEDDGSFTFHPRQGNYRGFYSCSSGSNFNRSATKEELLNNKIRLYWDTDTDINNQNWMITRFGATDPDTQASYFKATTW